MAMPCHDHTCVIELHGDILILCAKRIFCLTMLMAGMKR
jgi:hypothetical protein|tara:strand:+ start:130 stop:246 length:117 start_codon:yes stop_codon:yes gene_type:complete